MSGMNPFIFPSYSKHFREKDQVVSYSILSKAENHEEHNNERWLTTAGYTAKSLGKQPRSRSSSRSPKWITVWCPSVNLLNLVWPQRKHKTQAIHMLPSLFWDDLPVSSIGQALQNNSPLPTTLHAFQDTQLHTEEIDFTQGAIFIPFLWAACFSLVGQRRGDVMAAGFRSEQAWNLMVETELCSDCLLRCLHRGITAPRRRRNRRHL